MDSPGRVHLEHHGFPLGGDLLRRTLFRELPKVGGREAAARGGCQRLPAPRPDFPGEPAFHLQLSERPARHDRGRPRARVTELSNILRYSLQSGRTETVPLETELEAVTAYLKLEAIRLEERLRVHIEVDPESLETRIPPMLLQTLVENGIKHGVARLPGGGEIRVDSQVESRAVKIQVRNSGQLREDAGSTRLGLDNARERLRLLYGNAASLVLRNYDGDSVVAEISIPLSPA